MVMGNEQGNNLNTSFSFTTDGAPQVNTALKSISGALTQLVSSTKGAGRDGLLRLVDDKDAGAAAGFLAQLKEFQKEELKYREALDRFNKLASKELQKHIALETQKLALLQQQAQQQRLASGAIGSRTTGRTPLSELAAASHEVADSFVGQLRNSLTQVVSGGGRSRGGGFGVNTPLFAQFALYPAASLAGRLGSPGLAQGLFTGADTLGVVDNFKIFGDTITLLGNRVRTGLGPLSQLAVLAGNLAVPLGTTAASLASVLAVAAPLALVIGGVAAVFGAIQRQGELMKRTIENIADAVIDFNKRTASGATSEDIQGEIDRASRERSGLLGERDAVQQLFAEFRTRLLESEGLVTSADFADLSNRANQLTGGQVTDLLGGQGQLANEQILQGLIDRYSTRINDLSSDIAFGTTQLDSRIVAENDAAAIEEERRQRLEAYYVGITNAEIQFQDLTTQQLQERTEQNKQEYDQLSELRNRLTGQEREAVIERLDALSAEQQAIANLLPQNFIQALQRAIPAFQELQQEIDRLTGDFILEQQRALADRDIETNREAFDFSRDRVRDLEDFNKDLAQSDRDYQEDRQQSIDDFYAALAEEESDQSEEDLDRLTKFNREEQRRLEDHQNRLSKITRDANDDINNAIGERDALAAFKTTEKAKKDIADEQEQYEKQRLRRLEDFELQSKDQDGNDERARTRRIRAFERQLTDQEQQHNRERQRRIADFQQRLRDEDADRGLRLLRQQEDFRRQELLREQDFNRRIAQMQNQFFTETYLNNAFLNEVNRLMDGVRTRVESGINAIFSRGTRQGAPDAGFQFGGLAGNNLNGVPFQFTSQTQANAFGNATAGNGTTPVVYSPQISGVTRTQVLRELDHHSRELVERLYR